ncbi:2-polyprenyl-3-methyl-6-methoxy-1,4-benzoquinone monooxygenase [Gynuella sunshinyii]|nr:2-polyprenyl-3-methyl-6-methoxy-1,4-benzoquinone monooxygenase [Gynuella sunshinyii]
MMRRHTPIDKAIASFDKALKTLVPFSNQSHQPNPADRCSSEEISPEQSKHIAGLMRINHTGEVCAQALYQGQAATARLKDVRATMEQAADEEIDHLVWCEERLKQLNAKTSLLNPAFYGLSFTIGAVAGLIGDKYSLGFVAATEEQVCKHLQSHLQQIPESDQKSRAILLQMLEDEEKHATVALQSGGVDYPVQVKQCMSLIARVMTKTTYRI